MFTVIIIFSLMFNPVLSIHNYSIKLGQVLASREVVCATDLLWEKDAR